MDIPSSNHFCAASEEMSTYGEANQNYPEGAVDHMIEPLEEESREGGTQRTLGSSFGENVRRSIATVFDSGKHVLPSPEVSSESPISCYQQFVESTPTEPKANGQHHSREKEAKRDDKCDDSVGLDERDVSSESASDDDARDYHLTAFDKSFERNRSSMPRAVSSTNIAGESGDFHGHGRDAVSEVPGATNRDGSKEKEANQMPVLAFFVHLSSFGLLPLSLLFCLCFEANMFSIIYFAAFCAMCFAPRSWVGASVHRLPFICQGVLAPNFSIVLVSLLVSSAQIVADVVHQIMCKDANSVSAGSVVGEAWQFIGYGRDCLTRPASDMWGVGLVFASALIATGGHILMMSNSPSEAWAGLLSLSGVMSVLSTIATPEAILAGFTASAVQSLNAIMEIPLLIFVISVSLSLALPVYSNARLCLSGTFTPAVRIAGLRIVQIYTGCVVTVIFIFRLSYKYDKSLGEASATAKFLTGIDRDSDTSTPLVTHLLTLLCTSVVIKVRCVEPTAQCESAGSETCATSDGRVRSERSFKIRKMATLQLFYPWVRALHTPVNLALVLLIVMLTPSIVGMIWSFGWTALVIFGHKQTLSILFAALGLFHWAIIFTFGFSSIDLSNANLSDIGAISGSSTITPTGLAVIVFVIVLWNLMGLKLSWRLEGGVSKPLLSEDGYASLTSQLESSRVSYSANGAAGVNATTVGKQGGVANRISGGGDAVEGERVAHDPTLSKDPWLVRVVTRANRVAASFAHAISRLRPYFIAVAFLALFVAAVMTVNALHCGFLVLFSVVVVWQRCPPILWLAVIAYTVLLTHVLYGYWAFGPTLVESLEVIGFIDETKSVANLLPYYAFSAIFIYQMRIGAGTQADFSDSWQLFLGGLENVAVMLIAITTTVLFAVVASYEKANLMGEVYLLIFLFSAMTIFYKSFECPPSYIVFIWSSIIQPLVGIMVTAVYAAALLDASVRERIDKALSGTSLTCVTLGLSGSDDLRSRSVGTLWPKIAVMMLLIVLTRTWRSRIRVQDTRHISARLESESQQQQQQANRALQVLAIVSVVTVKLQRLIAVYSQGLAVCVLYISSAVSFNELGNTLCAVQGFYFLFALFASMFTRVRSSWLFWRLCQFTSGVWCIVVFTTQQPIVKWNPSPLQVYFGLYPQGLANSMWPYVGIHALVFASSALHCNIDAGGRRSGGGQSRMSTVPLLSPEDRIAGGANITRTSSGNSRPDRVSSGTYAPPAQALNPREIEEGALHPPRSAVLVASNATLTQDPPSSITSTQEGTQQVFVVVPRNNAKSTATTIADILASILELGSATVNLFKSLDEKMQEPMSYFRRFGYFLTLLSLIVAARVLYACVLGPMYLILAAVYGMLGKHRAISNYRWFILSLVSALLMVTVYCFRLGYPPDDDYAHGYLNRHLSPAVQLYLTINPTETQLILTIICWCVITLQRRAIRSYRGSKPFVGAVEVSGLTIADRLVRYAKEISEARKVSSKDNLLLYLPVPKDAKDLTQSKSFADRFRLFMFRYFCALLLVVAFIHAIYDTATSIDVLKLASQIVVMAFFQNFYALPWVGYRYWKLYFRFHVVWMLCRMIIFIPGIPYNSVGVCAMKISGLLPVEALMPTYITELPSTTCPGNRWNGGELAFHTVCVTLIWWQIVLCMKRDYAFVLHSLFDEEASSSRLGNTIRAFRLRAIRVSKHNQKERERERLSTLKQMIEVKGTIQAGGLHEGEDSDAHATVNLNDDEKSAQHEHGKSMRSPSPPDKSLAATGCASPNVHSLAAPTELSPNIRKSYLETLSAEHDRVIKSLHDEPLSNVRLTSASHQDGGARSTISQLRFEQQSGVSSPFFSDARFDSRSLAVLAGVSTADRNVSSHGFAKEGGRGDSEAALREKMMIDAEKKKLRAERKGFRAAFDRLWQWGREHIDEFIMWLDRNSLGLGANPVTQDALNEGIRLSIFAMTLYRFLLSYTDRLAFVTFCVHFAISPSVLTAVLPLTIFLYAAVVNPRPHKRYWQLTLIYIELVIVTKTILKATQCDASGASVTAGSEQGLRVNDQYSASPLHGRTCVAECYLVDMVLSLVSLVFVVIHISQLRRWGLHNDKELFVNHEEPSSIASEVYYAVSDSIRNVGRQEIKVGGDYCNAAFAVELVCFLYIFFAYYKLVGSSDNLVASLQSSILPGNLAVILILMIAIIIIDRVLYLLRSSYGKYIFTMLLAFVYHAIMIWWFVTQTEFVNTYYRENTFDVRGALFIAGVLYLLKGLYLYLGGSQVHHGWHDSIQHICFTGNYGTLESTMYMIARLTPFVYDLRVILDWTVSPSALKLNYWIKMEDIAHEVYLVLVDRQDTKDIEALKKTSASPYPKIFKYPIGVSFFGFLVGILVLPLLLYSSFSPVLESNSVESVKCTLTLDGVPSLWSSSNLKLESTGSITLNNTVVSLLQRNRPDLASYDLLRNNPQVFVLSNYSSSLWSITPPAMTLLLQQLNSSEKEMSFTFATEITNSAASLSNPTLYYSQRMSLAPEVREGMRRLLMQQSGSLALPNLFTPFYYNKAGQQLSSIADDSGNNKEDCKLYLSSGQGIQGYYFGLTCQTLFTQSTPQTDHKWNNLSPAEWRCLRQDVCENVQSDAARANFTSGNVFVLITSTVVLNAGFLQSIGIVAAYTTFILAIGRVLRFAMSGAAYRTTLEDMEDPQYLVCLIEYMMMIRGRKQYILEQQLYQELVNTIRDSSLLEKRTRLKQE